MLQIEELVDFCNAHGWTLDYVRQDLPTKTIGRNPRAPRLRLVQTGTHMPAATELTDFEAIILSDKGWIGRALLIFPNGMIAKRFRNLLLDPERSKLLAFPLDLSMPMAGSDLYEPEPYGGFVLRWMGPGRKARITFQNPFIQLAYTPNLLVRIEIMLKAVVPPQIVRMIQIRINGHPAIFSIVSDGRHYRVLCLVPLQDIAAASAIRIAFDVPFTLTNFPEAMSDTSRLFLLGLLAVEMSVFSDSTPGLLVNQPVLEDVGGQSCKSRHEAAAMSLGNSGLSVPDGDTHIRMIDKNSDGDLFVAISVLAGDLFFPRIAIRGTGDDEAITFSCYDLSDPQDDLAIETLLIAGDVHTPVAEEARRIVRLLRDADAKEDP